jgi:hypothetical protein
MLLVYALSLSNTLSKQTSLLLQYIQVVIVASDMRQMYLRRAYDLIPNNPTPELKNEVKAYKLACNVTEKKIAKPNRGWMDVEISCRR